MKLHTYGSGAKVALLLHGLASSSRSWRKLVGDLLELGYTVQTPDLPGHGEAARERSAYSVEKWQSMLFEQIEKADLLIGHSIGGLLALKARVMLGASKTVVIDPVLRFPPSPLRRVTQDVFGLIELGRAKFSSNPSVWDRTATRVLSSPRRIPTPDENVLLLRPKNSYVSPLAIINKAPRMKVVTFDKGGHNLHHFQYERFFNELQEFALKPQQVLQPLPTYGTVTNLGLQAP